MTETYACLFCARILEADEDGLFVHDDTYHPPGFVHEDDEEETKQ